MTAALDVTAAPPRARSRLASLATSLAALVAVVGLGLVPMLLPAVLHPLLDRSGSAFHLATSTEQVHVWSDRTVAGLLGTGAIAVPGPRGALLYGPQEMSHLDDVRLVLRAVLAATAVCVAALVVVASRTHGSRALWRSIGEGAVAAAGLVLVVALTTAVTGSDRAFTAVHRVVLPGGSAEFPVVTGALVRLYPPVFWQWFAVSWGSCVTGLAVVVRVATWVMRLRDRHDPLRQAEGAATPAPSPGIVAR